MDAKVVSIIIPALNEENVIGQCLDSLVHLGSSRESFEVIVVDNGSTARTLDVARSYSGILNLTVLEKADVHVSALRNLGASRARGDLFAFLDADCIVPPDWLMQATALLSQEGVGVVGAHFRIPNDAGWVARTWYGKLEVEKQGVLAWVPACNTWVNRDVFERVGRFDESIETNEDCEFCGRVRNAGYQVIGDSRIAVAHLGTPAGVWEFYRKIVWHATDGLRVFLRDPSALTNARPVLFGFYTLVCLAGLGIGAVLVAWQKRMDVAAVSLGVLLLPAFLLSLRLTLRRKTWADLFPLTLLNLVYGLARGRSLLVARNWVRSPGRQHTAALIYIFLLLRLVGLGFPVSEAQGITAIWANNGEDKVTRDELRATRGTNVNNQAWDGSKILIFGGRNEVVAFNVILEAGTAGASNVAVSFNSLNGPAGATIASLPATGNGVFDWTQRNIELFYVRYLQIKGLSKLSYETYDERHVPKRMRRPWSGNGSASGTWQSRPDHDKFYPEIAVPLELIPTFTIAAGRNQSIWVDVYIPKTAPVGNYLGSLVVQEGGAIVGSIPVQLKVYNYTLPDTPASKTMLAFSSTEINPRYLGAIYVNPASAAGAEASLLRDRHFMLAHRHRISLINDDSSNDCAAFGDHPCADWGPRLDGSLFTAAHGYNGPGVNTGNNVYSVGTYSSWSWKNGTQTDMNQHSDAWATWFSQNAPSTEYFLYLIDESSNYPQIQTWAQWILSNPGPGRQMKSMATLPLPTAASQTPSLDIAATTFGVGLSSVWQPLVASYTNDARKRFYVYNGRRPGSGSFATEDDGVALRELAWGQYKKHINRWFFWDATYYNNYQANGGNTDVFQTAQTFGGRGTTDPVIGQTGWNYSNGDGVLFYPGTDQLFPASSYGVNGPIASLRLKHWRRGIQDVDYLTLAATVDPTTTQNIVNQMVPRVLWEYGVDNPSDPTFVHTDISWSNDPRVWEAARLQLAGILDASGVNNPGSLPAPTLNLPPILPVNAQISAGYPSGHRIAGFQWSIIPRILSFGSPTSGSKTRARTAASNFFTPSASAQLASMNLSPGDYQISVMAVDSSNNISSPAQANVTLVPSDLSSLRVFPIPWRADRHASLPITFDHLTAGATLKVFTVSGHLVRRLNSSGGIATWDLNNDSGDHVASGIYLYVIKTTNDQTGRGQLVIIR